MRKQNKKIHGFTMIELIIVVALIGIIATIGIPVYRGYIASSKATIAQNNLRSIYLKQADYFRENGAYYTTGAGCDQSADDINTTLFEGKQVLDPTTDDYTYCIQQADTDDFTARAEDNNSSDAFTIDENNVTNW